MLGFAGSPWTVATYMIAGEGSKDQGPARLMSYRDPARMQAILDAIVTVSVEYLRGQIDAGAEAVQLFDSWAGSLAPDEFEKLVIAPNAAITAQIKQSHPDTPVIGFPKGAGSKLASYARETGVDAIGMDETLDPAWVDAHLPKGMPVQGNLDPLLVEAGGEQLPKRVRAILDTFADRPHVFNLGHGIGQFTPIEHVHELLRAVRG
jgi:uroporphyrinogen decarboxylase